MHMECRPWILNSLFRPDSSSFPVCLWNDIGYDLLDDFVWHWLLYVSNHHLISFNSKMNCIVYNFYFLTWSHCFVNFEQGFYGWHKHVLHFIFFYTQLFYILDWWLDPSMWRVKVVLKGKITLSKLYVLKYSHPQPRKNQLFDSISELIEELIFIFLSYSFFLLLMFVST